MHYLLDVTSGEISEPIDVLKRGIAVFESWDGERFSKSDLEDWDEDDGFLDFYCDNFGANQCMANDIHELCSIFSSAAIDADLSGLAKKEIRLLKQCFQMFKCFANDELWDDAEVILVRWEQARLGLVTRKSQVK
jgi:hypothetical protein